MAWKSILARAYGRIRPRRRRSRARSEHPHGNRFVGVPGLIAAGIASLLFASCANRLAAIPGSAASRADAAHTEGAAFLKDGNFELAIDRFGVAWKENPKHAGVARDFPDAVIGLKRNGDDAYQQGKLDEAGRKWTAALRATGHPAARGHTLPFGRAELRGNIDRVTASLLQNALVNYRNGNLEAAIADWRAVLSYDPGNVEAGKSVRTATTQLENLRKMTGPK